MRKHQYDKIFLGLALTLLAVGFIIFGSASLGLLARKGDIATGVIFRQIIAGGVLGIGALITGMKIDYKLWRTYATPIFVISLLLMVIVLIPGIGLEAGGARRWIYIPGVISFQPSEILKFSFVVYLSAWLTSEKKKTHDFVHGFIPFLVILGVVGGLLLAQPDTGTFMIFFGTAVAMFVAGGGAWSHIATLIPLSVGGVGILALIRPYVLERILTFFDPSHDALGSSYHVRQGLIAIGSGKFLGRGFGQSIQKFGYLPEPTTDSIFAVAAEEFGFIGSIALIGIFTALALRGLRIAKQTNDMFGRLLAIGIIMLVTTQMFINTSAMLGIIPLTGVPLPFISHGGTALAVVMFEVGVMLNISKHARAHV